MDARPAGSAPIAERTAEAVEKPPRILRLILVVDADERDVGRAVQAPSAADVRAGRAAPGAHTLTTRHLAPSRDRPKRDPAAPLPSSGGSSNAGTGLPISADGTIEGSSPSSPMKNTAAQHARTRRAAASVSRAIAERRIAPSGVTSRPSRRGACALRAPRAPARRALDATAVLIAEPDEKRSRQRIGGDDESDMGGGEIHQLASPASAICIWRMRRGEDLRSAWRRDAAPRRAAR